MPAPPARIRSASVPCGQNSTSSSPARDCRSNSAFSPTYDDTIFRICFVCRSRPRPPSSTPALFETQVRFFTPRFTSALMRFSGIPQRPKPPTTSRAPSGTSFTASSAEETTLSIIGQTISNRSLRYTTTPHDPDDCCHGDRGLADRLCRRPPVRTLFGGDGSAVVHDDRARRGLL